MIPLPDEPAGGDPPGAMAFFETVERARQCEAIELLPALLHAGKREDVRFHTGDIAVEVNDDVGRRMCHLRTRQHRRDHGDVITRSPLKVPP